MRNELAGSGNREWGANAREAIPDGGRAGNLRSENVGNPMADGRAKSSSRLQQASNRLSATAADPRNEDGVPWQNALCAG